MTERGEGEIRAEEEAQEAAREAAGIGGPIPDPDIDPAERPRVESGEGETEGFELADQQLERNASHEDPGGSPERDRFTPEVESDQSTAVYGDADNAQDTETEEEHEA